MILSIAAVAIFIWLGVLTWFIYKTRNHYDRLVSTTQKEKLSEVLDELLKEDKHLSKEVGLIRSEVDKLFDESRSYLQKVKLIRFNPFEKRGREQSFVIALLDKEKNGIVMNFMYTSDGLRMFTKKVMSGKGEEHELSEEEKKAIDE